MIETLAWAIGFLCFILVGEQIVRLLGLVQPRE